MNVLRQAQSIQETSDARRATNEETRMSQVAILSFEMAESIDAAGGVRNVELPQRSRPLP